MLTLLLAIASEVQCPPPSSIAEMLRAVPCSRAPQRGNSPPPASAQPDRLRAHARIDAAAAVKPALRVGIIEIVHDARHLHALVLVELMLELRVHARSFD